ncbi:MFS transporter [Microbaculum marinisediminis]|uniref:MFS transporter n=1 Tax=Microbaculum marinisediminis TaxID=2931392 RepID=A0AAW5QW70_9HYPH|nr:MFS transporter [Microbaculum sp. A6E488]MCT8971958.1 MFS transporter [Microbaculum sp. A6E488]
MNRTLRFVNIAHFLDHYFLLIFPTAVLAIHPTWDMSYGEALALGTPGFIAFALCTPLAGWLGDRYGDKPLMAAFFLGLGLSSIATGLAAGPITLALGLTGIGAFASIYHPVGTAMIVRLAARTGRALGVNGVYGNLGVAAAAGATGLLAGYLGWRAAFIVPGALTVTLGIAFAWLPAVVLDADGAGGPKSVEATNGDRLRVLAVVFVASLFGGIAFNGVTVALPKIFEERLSGGLDGASGVAAIGAYASLVFALAAFTQLPVGRLLDRIGAKPIMFSLTGLQAVLFFVLAQVDGALAVLVSVPLMLAVFGEIPVGAWLIGHYVAPAWRSRVYSIQFLLTLGVSSGIVPMIAVLHERTGSSTALLMLLGGAMAVVFAMALLLPGGMRAPRAAPQPAGE